MELYNSLITSFSIKTDDYLLRNYYIYTDLQQHINMLLQ